MPRRAQVRDLTERMESSEGRLAKKEARTAELKSQLSALQARRVTAA